MDTGNIDTGDRDMDTGDRDTGNIKTGNRDMDTGNRDRDTGTGTWTLGT